MLRHKHIVVSGWFVRYYDLFLKYRDEIVDLFTLDEQYTAPVEAKMKAAEDPSAIRLGIHIRRGDYKTAMPQFYYDDATYLRIMRELTGSLGDRVKFVAVSNEPVDMAFFRAHGLDLTEASGTPQEDVVTLSLCDYIVGPPSTFSWWAAYYGDKPRLSLRNRDDEVSLDKFAKVAALTSRFD